MDKVKIQDVAAEAGLSNAEVLDKAIELGFAVKVASSTISTENAEVLFNYIVSGELPQEFKKPAKKTAAIKSEKSEESVKPTVAAAEEEKISVVEPKKEKPKTSNISSSIKVTPKATAQEIKDKETNILAGMTIVKQKVQTPPKPAAVAAVPEAAKKKKTKKNYQRKRERFKVRD